MKKVKRRTFSGCVCEQEIYYISERAADKNNAKPQLRFKTPEERAAHREGISRRNHTRLFNANFGPTSLYSTLTMDNEHEVHTFDEAKKIRDNYIRRLKYTYPDAVVFAYLGRGRSTARIHLHIVSSGIPEEAIKDKWQQGEICRIEPLREHNWREVAGKGKTDCGQDYTGLANYLYDHWTPEQGGHRWKMTKNARKPEAEAAEPVKREYSEKHPPLPPKGYIYIECKTTPYGYQCYRYVKKPTARRRN